MVAGTEYRGQFCKAESPTGAVEKTLHLRNGPVDFGQPALRCDPFLLPPRRRPGLVHAVCVCVCDGT